jgi:hypothetical protein
MTPQKGPKKMDKKQLQTLLEQVANGGVKPEEALLQIKTEPYKDMGFAKLDTHRGIRQGMAEVIYGAGKTKEQILKIAQAMLTEQEKTVLITRMSQEAADYVKQYLDLKYDEMSRTGRIGKGRLFPTKGSSNDAETHGRCTFKGSCGISQRVRRRTGIFGKAAGKSCIFIFFADLLSGAEYSLCPQMAENFKCQRASAYV